MGLSLIDATHYHMEKLFIENMAGYLRDNMQAMQEDVKIYESTVNTRRHERLQLRRSLPKGSFDLQCFE